MIHSKTMRINGQHFRKLPGKATKSLGPRFPLVRCGLLPRQSRNCCFGGFALELGHQCSSHQRFLSFWSNPQRDNACFQKDPWLANEAAAEVPDRQLQRRDAAHAARQGLRVRLTETHEFHGPWELEGFSPLSFRFLRGHTGRPIFVVAGGGGHPFFVFFWWGGEISVDPLWEWHMSN